MAHLTEQIGFAADLCVHNVHLGKLAPKQRQHIQSAEAAINPIPLTPLAHLALGLQPHKSSPQTQFLHQLLQRPGIWAALADVVVVGDQYVIASLPRHFLNSARPEAHVMQHTHFHHPIETVVCKWQLQRIPLPQICTAVPVHNLGLLA